MEDAIAQRLKNLAGSSTLRLTHIGRKSGKAHQVTIWFMVEGDKIFLPTANIDRNWVRNVRKTPHVELAIGSEKFTGEARFLESQSDRDQVMAKVKRKYTIATPMLAISRLLAAIGIRKTNFGAFEVTLAD